MTTNEEISSQNEEALDAIAALSRLMPLIFELKLSHSQLSEVADIVLVKGQCLVNFTADHGPRIVVKKKEEGM